MLPRLLDDAKNAIETRMKFIGVSVVVDVVIAVLAVVALFFFTLAGFTWVEAEYGAVAASLAFGALFLVLAVALFIAARIRARRFAETELQAPGAARHMLSSPTHAPESGPEWLIAPVGIATGIEILRKIGARRLIPAFALSAVVITALQMSRSKEKAEGEAEK